MPHSDKDRIMSAYVRGLCHLIMLMVILDFDQTLSSCIRPYIMILKVFSLEKRGYKHSIIMVGMFSQMRKHNLILLLLNIRASKRYILLHKPR